MFLAQHDSLFLNFCWLHFLDAFSYIFFPHTSGTNLFRLEIWPKHHERSTALTFCVWKDHELCNEPCPFELKILVLSVMMILKVISACQKSMSSAKKCFEGPRFAAFMKVCRITILHLMLFILRTNF